MRLRRVVIAAVVLVAVAGLVTGLLSGFFAQISSAVLGPGTAQPAGNQPLHPSFLPDPTDPSTDQPASPTPTAPGSASPGGSSSAPALPPAVLPVAAETVPADPARVRARVAAAGAAPGRGGVEVVDGTGKVVYTANAKSPFIPASTNKLLTSAAALQLYGPEHRFRTTVVEGRGSGKVRHVVLVGGGDPYLVPNQSAADHPKRATLSALAAATAKSLVAKQRTRVTLDHDDTLFSGPAWNPRWPAGYRDQVSPTTSLWAVPKSPNPTGNAVDTFAKALRSHGITVTLGKRVRTDRRAPALAAVQSMTVAQIVRQLLLVSDNNATEVMLRQVGLKAGGGGSISGGRRGVQQTLTELGVWTPGTVIYDGSGLARENGIPPNTFAKLLRLAGTKEHARLRGLLTGLSVAGVEGSLRNRFNGDALHRADGIVHGKTGTLTGVRSLAGYLRPPDGTVLYYSAVVNGATDDYAAEIWLQRVALALVGCGCAK